MAEDVKKEEVVTPAPEAKEPKEEVKATAPEAKEPKEVKAPKSAVKFFRSRLNGLTVVLGNHKTLDPSELEIVRFVTRVELFQGDKVKVGYLATEDKRAHKILEADYNVEEISEKEYNTAMEAK